ncbi:glycosyltransferase [Pseudochelatococcus sp. B33]
MSKRRIIVVPPAAPGSKGDEGMVRGALELLKDHPVVILNPSPECLWLDRLQLDDTDAARVCEVSGPIPEFAAHLLPDDILFVLGADVVDGTCGLAPSLDRIELMTHALAYGLQIYVSCSFRSDVAPEILEQLRLLPGAVFLLRDAHSHRNFQRQTGLKGRAFQDLSFFCPGTRNDATETIRQVIAAAKEWRPVIGLNFAEHSFRSFHDLHGEDSRTRFVGDVLQQLNAAHPAAFYALLSNDERRWDNHPSDDDYQDLALSWIREHLGEHRAVKADAALGYQGNIAILDAVDLLVTGRMHLSLAAARVGTIPIVLMGRGKSYTSIDKMRGAFEKYTGTTEGVVSAVNELGDTSQRLLDDRDRLEAQMAERAGAEKITNEQDVAQLMTEIEGTREPASDDSAQLRAALMSALAGMMRRSDELARVRASTDNLREQLARDYDKARREIEQAAEQRIGALAALLKSERAQNEEATSRVQALEADLASERTQREDVLNQANARAAALAYERDEARRQLQIARGELHQANNALQIVWSSTSWRLLGPFRRLGRRFPTLARFIRRTIKLVWWTVTLQIGYRFMLWRHHRAQMRQATAGPPAVVLSSADTEEAPVAVADPARLHRILVADYRLPRADVSAGERATVGLIADLCQAGFEVVFCPTDMVDALRYRQQLEALGATVITAADGYRHASDYVRAEGGRFGTFYLIRFDVAEALLPTAREVAPDARFVFHAPDLYFLREGRAADLSSDPAARVRADETRDRELAMMHACDHVVLVSPAEVPFLETFLDRAKISVFPALYSPVRENPPGYQARRNIFFLGGFKHLPNVDAVLWFVAHVWPRVHAALPDAEFHIVGAEAPPEVVALESVPGVKHVGYVPDLDPVLDRYRLSVAPLLYGAGIKGKLGASLGAGVPSVCTTIAAEGMGIVDDVHALIRNEPQPFAEAVIDLYRDEALWTRIAANGRSLVEENFSERANRSAFLRVLDNAGVLPLDLYIDACQRAEPAAFPIHDDSQTIDVSIIVPAYNRWDLTRACLNSILIAGQATGLRYEVILADDGSTDDTTRAADLFPGLRVVGTKANLNFLLNCKNAAAPARGRHLLFLNNDTIVMPGWLEPLVRAMDEDPRVAIAGSKLLYPDGTIQESGAIVYSDGRVANLGRGRERRARLYSLTREIDYATGASMLVRGSFWKEVGGFDERFVPAYCEDSDLAMEARARNYRVICVAQSVAVHFEHGTFAEQSTATPTALAERNNAKLLDKWQKVLARDHLPPGTPPDVAAAHAERQPPLSAVERRKSGHLNVLYFSPFPSHPDNHGNQATIQAFGRRFRAMGHKVHFALLESHMYDAGSLARMQAAWDSVTILPHNCSLGSNGQEIPFDGWYDNSLSERIRLLCDRHDIDVVFCSYVFQSKMLDYVPAHILKVIDTHDKMGNRYEMLRRNGQPLEFFSCTPEEEGAYLRRADIVVARRAEEATYFNSVTGRDTAIVIPHVEEARFLDRRFTKLTDVGMVASANQINLTITLQFLQAIERRIGADPCPFTLHIAGQVRDMIQNLSPADAALFGRRWVRLHGFVPDIGQFYSTVDVIVSPVTMGTGINVKTVQAMAYGMPLLTTRWGGKGIETGDPMHDHADLDALAASLFDLTANPEALNALAQTSRRRYQAFYDASIDAMDNMFKAVKLS